VRDLGRVDKVELGALGTPKGHGQRHDEVLARDGHDSTAWASVG